jgi:hypothetical protein
LREPGGTQRGGTGGLAELAVVGVAAVDRVEIVDRCVDTLPLISDTEGVAAEQFTDIDLGVDDERILELGLLP